MRGKEVAKKIINKIGGFFADQKRRSLDAFNEHREEFISLGLEIAVGLVPDEYYRQPNGENLL